MSIILPKEYIFKDDSSVGLQCASTGVVSRTGSLDLILTK